MISVAHLDQFADELAGLTSVTEVLDSLHALAHPIVSVYAAWRYPIYAGDFERWREGINVFFHRTVTDAFRADFWPLAHKNGDSALAVLAMQHKALLIWSEGRPMLAMRGQESWLLDLAHKHGKRDGVYCPSAPWMVGYWTPHLLRGRYKVDGKTRRSLFMAAGYAAGRLEELIEPEKINGKAPKLTARQEGIIRLYAQGFTQVEIARKLEVSIDTARDITDAAKKKLGARSGYHAAIIAMRLHLIACRPLLIVGVLLCCHGYYHGGNSLGLIA